MDGLLLLAIITIGLTIFGIAAVTFGVDGRQAGEGPDGRARPNW